MTNKPMTSEEDCPHCRGYCVVDNSFCTACSGTGFLDRQTVDRAAEGANLIQKIQRAIADWQDDPDANPHWVEDNEETLAEAIAKAVKPGPVPDGWGVFPLKPTAEMIEAAWEWERMEHGESVMAHTLDPWRDSTERRAKYFYRAMLEAAPTENEAPQ